MAERDSDLGKKCDERVGQLPILFVGECHLLPKGTDLVETEIVSARISFSARREASLGGLNSTRWIARVAVQCSDDEALIQQEFQINLPFALDVAKSSANPANPVSHLGNTTQPFYLDPFVVSYGDPQIVQVTAARSLGAVTLKYQINGGAIKAYGVSSGERLASLPNVPTAKEQGVNYQMSIWAGIFAPKGTPKEIVDKLAAALDKALDDPDVKKRLGELGGSIPAKDERTPAKFSAFVKAEIARWLPILKAAAPPPGAK